MEAGGMRRKYVCVRERENLMTCLFKKQNREKLTEGYE